LTGYESFCLYHALKLHFTTKSYDYFKYGGKVSISPDAFDNRRDKYHFHKLSRKYTKDEYLNFLLANFIDKPNSWAGDLLSEEAHKRYLDYSKVIESLSYTFENECRDIFDGCENPNELLISKGEHPLLLKKVMRKEVSIQTLVILDSILNFLPVWKKNITDTIIWPEYQIKIEKYKKFLSFDSTRFKMILKKCL